MRSLAFGLLLLLGTACWCAAWIIAEQMIDDTGERAPSRPALVPCEDRAGWCRPHREGATP